MTRPFDIRTTSSREADIMRLVHELGRAAADRPEKRFDLFALLHDRLPALPLKVQIQTTTRCNAACEMCPYPLITSNEAFEHSTMSEERFVRILDDLRAGGVERLSLFLMNEPLLDKRMARWLALARRALPDVTLGLFTNGSALDRTRACALADAGLDELCVSVHGFDARTYEHVMTGLSYDRLRRNLDDVVDAAETGAFGTMALQIVTGDVPELARSTRLVPLRYKNYLTLKGFSNERSAVGVEEGLSSSTMSTADDTGACQRPFVKLYILATGECVLCNVDWKRTVILGRVGDGPGGTPIEAVWKGAPYRAVRWEHFVRRFDRASICARCDYARVVDS